MTSIVKPAEAPKWMTGILRQINNKFAAQAPTSGSLNIPVYKGTITYGDYSYFQYFNPSVPPKINGVSVTYDYSLPDASYYPNSLAALQLSTSSAQLAIDSRFVSRVFLLFSDGMAWNAVEAIAVPQAGGLPSNIMLDGPPPS